MKKILILLALAFVAIASLYFYKNPLDFSKNVCEPVWDGNCPVVQ